MALCTLWWPKHVHLLYPLLRAHAVGQGDFNVESEGGGESMLAVWTTRVPHPGFTLLSIPLMTLIFSDPEDGTLTGHKLMDLMFTCALKVQGFEFVNIPSSGHPLSPKEWTDIIPCTQHPDLLTLWPLLARET